MKQHLSKVAGLAILALLIQTSGFAQDEIRSDDEGGPRKYDEIVIRHKSGKDAKLTIEIKDGDVLVNGKPVSEYEDSSISIRRRKVARSYSNSYSFSSPDLVLGAPHIESDDNAAGWSYDNNRIFKSNRAVLGVNTERNGDGKGAKITQITKESAAAKAGLELGDVITKVDDEEINESQSLSSVIGGHDPGDKVTITYKRDGKEEKKTVELGKGKNPTAAPFVYKFDMPDLKGLSPEVIPDHLENYFNPSPKFGIRAQDAEDGKGVKVLNVDDESTAAKAGIKEGDVITRFDGKEINSVTQLTEAAHAAKEKISVKATIVRDGKSQEVEVKVPRRLRTADM